MKMEIRQTDASSTNRAGSRISSRPFAIQRQILPIPVALIDEPLIPFIVLAGIGLSSKKLVASGEMWMVAPVSRMKGPTLTERVV